VTGVVAQILQLNPNATADEVSNILSCSASPMVLDIQQDKPPAVTRNLLLQVPTGTNSTKVNNEGLSSVLVGSMTCDLGLGCEKYNRCSGRGICQEGQCLCDALAWYG
jgi:hypothetical protein